MKYFKTFESFLYEAKKMDIHFKMDADTEVVSISTESEIIEWLRDEIGTDKKAPFLANIYFDDSELVLGDVTVATRMKKGLTLGELADMLKASMKKLGYEKLRPVE